ncbi:hypothetical protein Bmyc01_54360 [Bacillus mycoides]|nr:hypothetical protein Bmyc01_54360 [Bacillus mycoides]
MEKKRKHTDQEVYDLFRKLDSEGVKITKRFLIKNGYSSHYNHIYKYMGGLNEAKKQAGIIVFGSKNMERKHTDQEIYDLLRKLSSEGVNITQKYLKTNYVTYYSHINNNMGGINEVKRYLGIDTNLSSRKGEKTHADEDVYNLFIELHDNGINITEYLLKEKGYNSYYQHVIAHMGGIRKVKIHLGIMEAQAPPIDRGTDSMPTEKECIELFKELHSKGIQISQNYLRENGLVQYLSIINAYMGGINNLKEFLNIPYVPKVYEIMEYDECIELLKKLDAEGVKNPQLYMRENGLEAYANTINNHMGGFRNAKIQAGLEVLKQWNKEKVIKEIKRLHTENVDLSIRSMIPYDSSLLGAANRHVGSWEKAIELAGINYEEVNPYSWRESWEEENVLKSLKEIHDKGEEMTASRMFSDHASLYIATRKRFGSYEKALELIGLNYDEIRQDSSVIRNGNYFEELLQKVFNYLNIEHKDQETTHFENGTYGIPDFKVKSMNSELHDLFNTIPFQEIWIDSKLSRWTRYANNSKTEKKYIPHCDKLIFVYLRGREEPEGLDQKVTNICVYDLLPYIKDEDKHVEIKKELDDLLQDVENNETV